MTETCIAALCERDAVGIVDISFDFMGKTHDYSYPYCQDDLSFFFEKFSKNPKFDIVVMRGV